MKQLLKIKQLSKIFGISLFRLIGRNTFFRASNG